MKHICLLLISLNILTHTRAQELQPVTNSGKEGVNPANNVNVSHLSSTDINNSLWIAEASMYALKVVTSSFSIINKLSFMPDKKVLTEKIDKGLAPKIEKRKEETDIKDSTNNILELNNFGTIGM